MPPATLIAAPLFGAVFLTFACMALLTLAATAPATLAPVPVLAAATASLTRLILARRAAWHCLTTRAALS